jgi:polysaccharide deacetylase family protein (PEP-CTERM system associated)
MHNALTIDVEEYYHATAFSANAVPSNRGSYVSRVEQNTQRIIDILAGRGCLATFFVVGSVAERFPRLIQRILRAGHEIACHSFAHCQVFTLTRNQFYEDTRRAKLAIENAAGVSVHGYRAPSFSITKASPWAFELLAELGFTYDSSILPAKHINFEMQYVPRHPFVIVTSAGSILEFPMTTLQISGTRAPLAGGAYLRLLPYWYTRWGIRYLNASESLPACVYLHPWELDPAQPRMKGSLSARMRHYFGLRRAEVKFRRLLMDFEFQPLGLLVKNLSNQLSQGVPQIRDRELISGKLPPYSREPDPIDRRSEEASPNADSRL